MSESIVIIALTIAAVVSIGVDNLLLLMGFKGRASGNRRQVSLGFLGAFMVILSLGVVTSLFAETRQPFTFLIAGTGLAMAFFWTSIAGWVARHPSLARGVRDRSPCVLPLILIFVGWYVLSDTATDTF